MSRGQVESRLTPQDCNYGLLEQVMNSISRRRILRIQTMYSRMTVRDLAAKVGLSGPEGVQQVGMVLQDMVSTSDSIDSCAGRPKLTENTGRDEKHQRECLRRCGSGRHFPRRCDGLQFPADPSRGGGCQGHGDVARERARARERQARYQQELSQEGMCGSVPQLPGCGTV